MNPKVRQGIIYVLFAAAIVWGVYNIMPEKENASSTETTEDNMRVQINEQAVIPQATPLAIDTSEYEALPWGPDPFFRSRVAVRSERSYETPLAWELGGILYSNEKPSAVINKKIVREGDQINGARVVKINQESVILESNGSRFKIKVDKDMS